MKIWVKKHGEVLAACDEDIAGKAFESGKLCLDVRRDFYCGELVGEKEFGGFLEDGTNINLVGERAVAVAKSKKLISRAEKIGSVPYAMIFRV